MTVNILAVDPDKCTGCHICSLICSFTFYKEFNPKKSRVIISNWPREGLSVPTLCWQCEKPWCADACPTDALTKDPKTGVVHLNYDECTGCKQCIYACPFGAIYLIPGEDYPVKCETCNGDPPCAKYCPTGAITWIDKTQVADAKRRKAAKKRVTALLDPPSFE